MVSGKDNGDSLGFTGERMIPGEASEESEYEHLARYIFALPVIKGLRTLDAGCGDGYGSALLAESASEVVGIDISSAAIERASKKYKIPNLSFKVMDVRVISFDSSSFDAVVGYEVFEHIHTPQNMVEGARRVLTDTGILIVSTPNGALIKSGLPNPYHVREYRLDEFNSILTEYFPEAKFEYERYGLFNLRRRGGRTGKAIGSLMKLKRKLGIGKILPESISRKIKDTKNEPYSIEDFEFRKENIEDAEYFIFIIRGKA